MLKSVSNEVDIQAGAATVWAVLEDVRLLPELSTSTVAFDAPSRLSEIGQRFSQTVELAGRGFTSEWTMEYRLPLGPLARLAGRLGAERRAVEESAAVVEGVRRMAMRAAGTA